MDTVTVSKSNLMNMLKTGIVSVTFRKTDGTERTMKCTLADSLVKQYEKKTERTKTINEDVIPVFDIEKDEWRSFKYSSIIFVYK